MVALLLLSGGAFAIALHHIRAGLWLSVATSSFTFAGLFGAATLLFLRMLDRRIDQRTGQTSGGGAGDAAEAGRD